MQKILPFFFRVVHANDAVVRLSPCCLNVDLSHKGCKVKDLCPIHGGQEIWYHSGMDQNDTYKVCGKDGDGSCGNRFIVSVEDHRFYFERDLAEHCLKKSVVVPM